ncbi:SET domain-containing protein [Laetiporus sulphureus 93-53]|uniref:SET domain-containing protein n=1 Tax=Laetiporus sulphureus 93-53 TaxID=1314785 RepID=A0A165FKZ4_9APHY|nr:SET domain-containing protein [Laetiporus sulphureus 93-53]KZT09128.1 SET domain-containing protein [Laetiporus sulphureus 93-53]
MEQSVSREVCLEHHPTARNKAVAARSLNAGSVIITVPALSSVLYQSAKGQRCDACHRLSSSTDRLRKCTGCAGYWYCGTECQTKQWKAHHRIICKELNRYLTSPEYQSMSEHDRVDALLVSQLFAQFFPNGQEERVQDDQFSTFMDLMKSPARRQCPPLCIKRGTLSASQAKAQDLYDRFGNNNFILHSHLNSYAHGIFPQASRLFNHSCMPNAVAKYIITPSEPVRMDVIALRNIVEGEEITLPYLDPALPSNVRQEALRSNYGFACKCDLCSVTNVASPIVPPPRGSEELENMEIALHIFIFGTPGGTIHIPRGTNYYRTMPDTLTPLLHESYLPAISEIFSRASHEGQYEEALHVGPPLLALYFLKYPLNYPQIGMHALELAKTAWNAIVMNVPTSSRDDVQAYLAIASQVLNNLGPEGDGDGPLEELRLLKQALGENV